MKLLLQDTNQRPEVVQLHFVKNGKHASDAALLTLSCIADASSIRRAQPCTVGCCLSTDLKGPEAAVALKLGR